MVAKALLYNSNGQILILERSSTHPRFAGHFDLPGGEIEPGEDSAQATIREIFEETGIIIPDTNLDLLFDKYSKIERAQHVLHKLTLSSPMPRVTLSWEHSNYFWLTPEQILKSALPPNADGYFVDVVEYLVGAFDFIQLL